MERIFEEMEFHLLNDKAPSEYVAEFVKSPIGREYPFSMIGDLEKVPQSPVHHPEGNVLNHTLLVLDNAAGIKDKSNEPRAFMWAALLHDLGKIKTTRIKRGRITAYDHDRVGADMAEDFLKKAGCKGEFVNKVCGLVRWHMQILYVTKNLKFADIESMKRKVSAWDVALLGLCDRLGRGEVDREKEIEEIKLFLKKCRGEDDDELALDGLSASIRELK